MPVITVQSYGITADAAPGLARSVRAQVTAALPGTDGVCQCRVVVCAGADVPDHVPAPNAWVEVTMFPGRSTEDKRALYTAIVAGLRPAGIVPGAVTVVLREPALENWGIRGGRPASEVLRDAVHSPTDSSADVEGDAR
ncbi:tautomerase family protein [Streptomyces acidiscabies]|uniref:tautomerase family protein n=1 Tax=Streptomyces acidiscabies TaxID=42234 RepID=UPI0009518EB5|nr:tautomerase family protein [Streptomyces acidiscabies]